MTDYWLSKLFFDLQSQENTKRWREDRDAVLKDYPISEAMKHAVFSDDIAANAPHVNAYLLRFYFSISGMSDPELLERLHALKPQKEAQHG